MAATGHGAGVASGSRPRRRTAHAPLTVLAGAREPYSNHDGAPGVARLRLEPGVWVLALMPAGLPEAGAPRDHVQEVARRLVYGYGPGPSDGLSVVLVPDDVIDPVLGPAVM